MTSPPTRSLREPGLLAALLCAVWLAGCAIVSPDATLQARGEGLAEARERWAATGLESYVWTVDQACYCAAWGRVEVRVEDGRKVSVTRLDEGPAIAPEQERWFPTVDELFDVVERALEEAASLEVEYDDETGAPLLVDIDWIRNAIDDEVIYTATPPAAVDGALHRRGREAGGARAGGGGR